MATSPPSFHRSPMLSKICVGIVVRWTGQAYRTGFSLAACHMSAPEPARLRVARRLCECVGSDQSPRPGTKQRTSIQSGSLNFFIDSFFSSLPLTCILYTTEPIYINI